jgi:hypothetical protein
MKKKFIFLLLTLLIISCSNSGSDQEISGVIVDDNNSEPEWLIPRNEVLDGGPGKDGIPSIDEYHQLTIQNLLTFLHKTL